MAAMATSLASTPSTFKEYSRVGRVGFDSPHRPGPRAQQVDWLAATRAKRDSALADLRRAATEENLMPPIIAAARATEGEMIAAMQEVFGTYTESPVF